MPLFLDQTKPSFEVLSQQRLLQFSVVYSSRLSKSPQQIFHAGSKISLAKGIDEWVAKRADHETAVGDESCFGGNFNASGEISEQSANPRWEETQKKRHDYDVDICSCSSFCLPPNHLLLTLLAFFLTRNAFNLNFKGVYVCFRCLVHRPVEEHSSQEWQNN